MADPADTCTNPDQEGSGNTQDQADAGTPPLIWAIGVILVIVGFGLMALGGSMIETTWSIALVFGGFIIGLFGAMWLKHC